MLHITEGQPHNRVSRREAMRRLAVIGTGVSIGLATGCTPLKIGLGVYPRRFDTDHEIREWVLLAFAETVIPGCDLSDPNLTRVFDDDYYPLAKYSGYLIADLCDRADLLFQVKLFHHLGEQQRVAVVNHALSAQRSIRRLYEGAIFLTQISCYAGIYDSARGCPLIDFPGGGPGRYVPFPDQTYPDPKAFLARSLTGDGNFS